MNSQEYRLHIAVSCLNDDFGISNSAIFNLQQIYFDLVACQRIPSIDTDNKDYKSSGATVHNILTNQSQDKL